ncbi:hypothetical protein VE00_07270 [Pseudogymnoascus sp. WSF 3629]|nr:hypothetical protein VE00_07270 [Pseudogymnoascus sp. WSF 3629]
MAVGIWLGRRGGCLQEMCFWVGEMVMKQAFLCWVWKYAAASSTVAAYLPTYTKNVRAMDKRYGPVRVGAEGWARCTGPRQAVESTGRDDVGVKQVFRTHPRYHRLDTEFDGPLPRLDNTRSMPELQLKAQEDLSVSNVIENIARCAIASLFYFELSAVPEGCDGGYTGTGLILCSIRRDDPALSDLLDQLSGASAMFYLNDCPLSGTIGDSSFIGKDGNFRRQVELSLAGKFTISLKQGDSEACNISGSPYLVNKLVSAQGLDAHFGRADHRKRKRSVGKLSARKRLWVR